ncbi:S8 family peptidase [Chryseobacterium oryctis]|uniref:S8 family peptidase n=1 Tax=Chryseobacterium oryctis TaxID=2952618 RepID=A0ABT3HNI7_9FLAO|nr:S8 family peptidase [Chryseobacterium oryctis]MCW3161309.1 S8 family peptidase [Chryseobacterium oryctis]
MESGKSPVQVVLNADNFIQNHDRPPGGTNKDFFAENNAMFKAHKNNILSQLDSIENFQEKNKFSRFVFAKVTLRPSALAKSHRPTARMFKNSVAPVVGGGELGEIYVGLNSTAITELKNTVEKAEENIRTKFDKDGNEVPNPSAIRSEVGSIDSISVYGREERRKFSSKDAVEWLADKRTGGLYLITLFESIPAKKDWNVFEVDKVQLFESFLKGLESLPFGTLVFKISDRTNFEDIIGVKILNKDERSYILTDNELPPNSKVFKKETNLSVDNHEEFLNFIDQHPLVKSIGLPSKINKGSALKKGGTGKTPSIKKRSASKYPKVGIVDGGVSTVFNDWISAKHDFLHADDADVDHGTFIAGLLISGRSLNGDVICREDDGCEIIDLDILPLNTSFDDYFLNPIDFYNELEEAIQILKAETGVRIFNFSLNIDEHVSSSGYSFAARKLDAIAEENDIVFVISAGNITNNLDIRKEWSLDANDTLSNLISSRNDRLKVPAESCRNISVTAINPLGLDNVVPYALSNYSCRGPVSRVGVKPDFCHFGGSGTANSTHGTGLKSINKDGEIETGCGTSYSAPLVAKTLAAIDNSIEGDMSKETLLALCYHNSEIPELYKSKEYEKIAKHLIGFGIPIGSDQVLQGDSSSITLVFSSRILERKKMKFDFSWPSSLVAENKCQGKAKLTLVSTPHLNYSFGAEYVRANITAHLRQYQQNGSKKGRLEPLYSIDTSDASLKEKKLIEDSYKWSPIKIYEKSFKKGVGNTTDWVLEVEYLLRDGEEFPEEGIPFTAILTISDLNREKPIFNEVKQNLGAIGVNVVDIQNATRIVSRV